MGVVDSVLPQVSRIPPYQPGTPIAAAAREVGLDPAHIIKLASNENPLGMSAAAHEAVWRTTEEGELYPDAACYDLTQALSRHTAAPPQEIICGAGSGDLIVLAARAFLDSTRAAVTSQYAFTAYGNAIRAVGAREIAVPADGFGHDLEAMAAAAADDTVRVVFVSTVNNPTGSALEPEALERFFEAVPPDRLIVLDEAYREYMAPRLQGDVEVWRRRWPNILALRTFSKAHGLASLRVGYGLGDAKVVEMLKRLQTPFIVNALGQAAAVAALGDAEFVQRTLALNAEERASLALALAAAGFEALPSEGNFLLVRVGDGAGAYRAMLERGVIVRPVGAYGLADWVRITVGLPNENAAVLAALKAVRPDGSPLA